MQDGSMPDAGAGGNVSASDAASGVAGTVSRAPADDRAERSADAVDAAHRLGAALDRIARLAPRARDGAGSAGGSDPAPNPDLPDVAARLDRLIAQLRGVIAGLGAGGTQS